MNAAAFVTDRAPAARAAVTADATVRRHTGTKPVTPMKCDKCGAPITDELFVLYHSAGERRKGIRYNVRHNYCRACSRIDDEIWPRYTRPTQCKRCGRTIRVSRFARLDYCGEQCASATRSARRRARSEPVSCCVACGVSFTPKRSDARYCSNKCRQQAYRERAR